MTRPRDVIRKMQKRITELEGEFREKDAEIHDIGFALLDVLFLLLNKSRDEYMEAEAILKCKQWQEKYCDKDGNVIAKQALSSLEVTENEEGELG